MNLINKITIRVIAVFMTAILTSFIPDTFPEFFGDVKCQGSVLAFNKDNLLRLEGCKLSPTGRTYSHEHAPDTHWGTRHYMWAWMSFCIGLIQFVNIGAIIYNHLENNESR